jgi:hypothetical protein
MGKAIVPELIRNLRTSSVPIFLMDMLRELTGTNPVTASDRGYTRRMIAAWVACRNTFAITLGQTFEV